MRNSHLSEKANEERRDAMAEVKQLPKTGQPDTYIYGGWSKMQKICKNERVNSTRFKEDDAAPDKGTAPK